MSDFFENWALALSGVIVFGSMCEMIMPSGVYKKYVHLTIGIMLVLTVLKPITNFKGDIKTEISDSTGEYAEYTEYTSAEMRQRDEIIKIYKAKLCEKIKATAGDEEVEVKCEICEEEQDFGKIESICIESKNLIDKDIKNILAKDYGIVAERIIVKENSYGN